MLQGHKREKQQDYIVFRKKTKATRREVNNGKFLFDDTIVDIIYDCCSNLCVYSLLLIGVERIWMDTYMI